MWSVCWDRKEQRLSCHCRLRLILKNTAPSEQYCTLWTKLHTLKNTAQKKSLQIAYLCCAIKTAQDTVSTERSSVRTVTERTILHFHYNPHYKLRTCQLAQDTVSVYSEIQYTYSHCTSIRSQLAR